MLPNEEFALACRAYYEEQGLIVDATNGQFAHCPLPKGMGETGYYLLWEHHQQQGLLQSRDVGRRCFYTYHAKKWLLTANYFPNNYFELWDIYEEFAKSAHLYTPERNRKRAKSREKQIEVKFPNDKIGVYPSLSFASLSLGITIPTLSRWARLNREVKPRHNKGYSARYL